MSGKIAVIMIVAFFAVGICGLWAQEGKVEPIGGQEGRSAGRVQNVQTFRQAFNTWFDQMTTAFEQNDREKMGQLMEEMQENRQAWRQRPQGGEGGGMWVRRRNQPDQVRADGTAAAGADAVPREEEKKILAVLEDMNENQRRGMMNVPPEDGKVLRLLTEATGARNVVEIGTSNGYSGIWFCLALKKTGGKLITHEIDEGRASLARKNFERAGVSDYITLVMGDAHENVKKLEDPIDILFLDADKEGYNDYLNKLLPLVRQGGLILAHNTNMSRGMGDYLEAITINPDLETLFIHKDGAGMGITLKKR